MNCLQFFLYIIKNNSGTVFEGHVV